MERTRAWRRRQAWLKQTRRLKQWFASGWTSIVESERRVGQLKKNSLRCGCSMCKPWKLRGKPVLPISDRRKLEKCRSMKLEYESSPPSWV